MLLMGGKFSRQKGRLGEQNLVLYLAKLGYKAERILRQYQEAGQPDVKAVKNGTTLTFENKSKKKGTFTNIYNLYYAERDSEELLCFVVPDLKVYVALSTDFTKLSGARDKFFDLVIINSLLPARKRAYKKLIMLKEQVQSADYLVIKENNKPMIFIKYWT